MFSLEEEVLTERLSKVHLGELFGCVPRNVSDSCLFLVDE